MWVETPRVYKNRDYPRTYNPTSTRLKNEYRNILNSKQPLLFLRHQDFKARDLIKLRKNLVSISSFLDPKVSEEENSHLPRLIGARSSALGVAFRECDHLKNATRRAMKKLIGKGAVFILSLPGLDPPQLTATLRILDRAVMTKRPPPTPEEISKAKQESEADFVPGKEQKRRRPNLTPQLELICALLEGRAYPVSKVRKIATLPPIGTLHSQLVGLVSNPANQLTGILSQGAGGQLVRTLQGIRNVGVTRA